MPPVKTAASSSDVDTEATAELPVLDVAAYESTLNDPIASTDTWAAPAPGAVLRGCPAGSRRHGHSHAACPPSPTDSHGPERHARNAGARPSLTRSSRRRRRRQPRRFTAPIVLPPSPPLIEELRNALAAAERRIEELNERARIADAERAVAVGRVQRRERATARAARRSPGIAAHRQRTPRRAGRGAVRARGRSVRARRPDRRACRRSSPRRPKRWPRCVPRSKPASSAARASTSMA